MAVLSITTGSLFTLHRPFRTLLNRGATLPTTGLGWEALLPWGRTHPCSPSGRMPALQVSTNWSLSTSKRASCGQYMSPMFNNTPTYRAPTRHDATLTNGRGGLASNFGCPSLQKFQKPCRQRRQCSAFFSHAYASSRRKYFGNSCRASSNVRCHLLPPAMRHAGV